MLHYPTATSAMAFLPRAPGMVPSCMTGRFAIWWGKPPARGRLSPQRNQGAQSFVAQEEPSPDQRADNARK
jgi:hypothetical protein